MKVNKNKQKIAILIPEVHAVGAIAVIRSLGRAGYKVHAISFKLDALGFDSSYSFVHAVAPSYSSGEFIGWFRKYVNQHNIFAVITIGWATCRITVCF